MPNTDHPYPLPGVLLDWEDVPRPIVIRPHDMVRGEEVPLHRHRRGQLVYAHKGLALVTTAHGAWVMPPNRAVWVPGNLDHGVKAITDTAMASLFVTPGTVANLPRTCAVVEVPKLLRELILHANGFADRYDDNGPEGRVIAVIIDMLESLKEVPLHLPMPRDARLKRIAEAIVEAPADTRNQSEWAKHYGVSVRTLARQFPEQTGMSFGQWRQQARLMAALGRLADGEPVVSVALDLGYASQSAFIAMFKKALGVTPGQYFRK
ncbi:helix-turn-helix transcriptional regulator [Magnetovibrio sp.]|uniref:AraC family transcriptional regulator n=1 Tax=Magnetovibrio sp. TaxID=2024836 RepID=UPI002F95C658